MEIAQLLKNEGAIDFFNALYGTMDTTRALAEETMPGMGSPTAPWVEPVGAFRREVGLPVFHAARIAHIASARFAVSEGKLDMTGMTRAQIADPYIVQKLMTGCENEIRPCVGATRCQSSYRPSCLHNPATGREMSLGHVIRKAEGPVLRSWLSGAVLQNWRRRASALSGVITSRSIKLLRTWGQILIGAAGGAEISWGSLNGESLS